VSATAPSLRRRLLAAAALWITLALGVVGLLLVLLFRHHVERELAERAQTQLDALIAGLRLDTAAPPRLTLVPEPPDPAFRQPLGGWYWLVSVEGMPQLRSRSWWDHAPPLLPDGPAQRLRIDGPGQQRLLLWTRSVELAGFDTPAVVAVGADATRLQGLTRSFAVTVLMALAVLALTLWAAAWLQVRSGLAPLARLQTALQQLRQGQAARLQGAHPAEVQPLVDELHAVLDERQELLERARQQAGNLAHGLKTPLAVIGNLAQRWPGEDGEVLRQQLERMERQIDWQLMRARAAARTRSTAATPVLPALEELRRVLLRLHAERKLQWVCVEPAPRVAVEPESLKEMLGNLLDNACKWAQGQVRVRLSSDGARVRIEVEDDGPGIVPEQRAQALQRGRRLDERRSGSGLGLAIVDELARLHDGTLELADADLGGLRAVLWLPAAGAGLRA
jgi:signal transduction histidine kinase